MLHLNKNLRTYSEPNDIKAGIDVKHLELIGAFTKKLPEKDRQCIVICDQGYGDVKSEDVNGTVLGIANQVILSKQRTCCLHSPGTFWNVQSGSSFLFREKFGRLLTKQGFKQNLS